MGSNSATQENKSHQAQQGKWTGWILLGRLDPSWAETGLQNKLVSVLQGGKETCPPANHVSPPFLSGLGV